MDVIPYVGTKAENGLRRVPLRLRPCAPSSSAGVGTLGR